MQIVEKDNLASTIKTLAKLASFLSTWIYLFAKSHLGFDLHSRTAFLSECILSLFLEDVALEYFWAE